MRRKTKKPEPRTQLHSYITPGEQMTGTISALPCGNAETILRAISRNNESSTVRTARQFTAWTEITTGIYESHGSVKTESGKVLELKLVLGRREGLFLADAPGWKCSLKHQDATNGFEIRIGEHLAQGHVNDLANQIVGWFVHGNFWENRYGDQFDQPYGDDPNRPAHFSFTMENGAVKKMTLKECADQGGVRSSHVGNWKPHTLIPAACGIPILLHEFTMHGNTRTETFGGHPICDDAQAVWAPYCKLKNSAIVGNGFHPEIVRLARESRTPFAFHLHATKQKFPNVTLESTYFMGQLGERRLGQMLRTTAISDPERFGHLIDVAGMVHRLAYTTSSALMFEDGYQFPVAAAPENVMETFHELISVERDPDHAIPRKQRLIPDSSFYVVTLALASQRNGSSLQLLGPETYRHQIEKTEKDRLHTIRNERLFRMFREQFGLTSLTMSMFPPITAPITQDQYALELGSFERERWLQSVLGN